MPSQRRSLFRRVVRSMAFALAGLVILLLLAAGAGVLWLSRADLRPIVEQQASLALGRRVTMGTLQVRWGDPLGIDFTDLAIANAPWGSRPDMVRIGRFSALLDVRPLLHGVLRYERLRMSDVTVVLERDDKGKGNWKFGIGDSGLVLVPKNRAQFPTLIDFAGERGLVTYRTHSGRILRIGLDRVAISSPGEAAPARLTASGSYNDVPLRLDATTDSYAALRDAGRPFGTRFTLKGKDTDLAFDGTLAEPLDFEGAHGELSIDARTLDDILGAMGAKGKADLPVSAAGNFRRDHGHWSLDAAKGRLRGSDFSGDLALVEGRSDAPDMVKLDLDLDALDLDALAAAFAGKKHATRLDSVPLYPPGLEAVDVTAALKTARLTVAGRALPAVVLDGSIAAGKVKLDRLRFAIGGGTLSLAGTLDGEHGRGNAALQGRLAQLDMSKIARELGGTGAEIHGQLDGLATLALHGATIGPALKDGTGAAVVRLRSGEVARSLIERVSVDLRSLFREGEGNVPISCLLGVATLRDGIAILAPLRLESPDAVVVGAGKLDLVKDRIDLTVKTERDSTNFFALDVPIRISGPLKNVSADPLLDSDEDWLEQPSAAPESLPPPLRKMAGSSSCRD